MLILDTVSGRKLDLDDPKPDQICLEDIASALSKVCRFGAQPKRFYSVAQHAVHVSRMVEDAGRPDLALAALHHDSHEAYLCDLPKPVKNKLEDAKNFAYKQLGDALDAVIAEALGVTLAPKSSPDGQVVKRADDRALLIEARRLLHDRGAGIARNMGVDEASLRDLEKLDDPLSPDDARQTFIAAHERLTER
jgi:5'-deoxynucleotidase YfbR-like HD superfamily hydrolase